MARRTHFSALLLGASFALALTLAACGTMSGSPGSSGGLYGTSSSPSATATSPASAQGSALLAMSTANVAGTSESILTNAQGMTLYYFLSDTSKTVACTSSNGCASFWPPLLAGTGTPTASGSLPGTLGVLDGANGKQVTYNGHPLYTFSQDKAPGDTKGEGIMGKWHVATPGLPAASSGSTTPQATPTTSGYGYGG